MDGNRSLSIPTVTIDYGCLCFFISTKISFTQKMSITVIAKLNKRPESNIIFTSFFNYIVEDNNCKLEYEDLNLSVNIVEHYHELIFEEALESWWTNKKDWPKNRDFTTFLKWFDMKLHSMVLDLVDEPLEICD